MGTFQEGLVVYESDAMPLIYGGSRHTNERFEMITPWTLISRGIKITISLSLRLPNLLNKNRLFVLLHSDIL